MKKYIYGAGFNCEKCIKVLDGVGDIVGILDQDQKKWNKKKMGIPIVPVETIEETDFDTIIVSVADYTSIVDFLITKGVEIEKISVYNIRKNIVIPLSQIYEDYIEKNIYRKNAIKQIKIGLLMEAYRNREFQNANIVSVFGKEKDFQLIKSFFEETGIKTKLVYNEVIEQEKELLLIYILCGSDYKYVLREIREKQQKNMKWIILPLYDVDNSLDWK